MRLRAGLVRDRREENMAAKKGANGGRRLLLLRRLEMGWRSTLFFKQGIDDDSLPFWA